MRKLTVLLLPIACGAVAGGAATAGALPIARDGDES